MRRSGHRRPRLLVAGDKQLQLRGPAAGPSCGPGLFTPAAAPRENVIIVINLRGCQQCQPSVATPVSAQLCAVKMSAVKMFLHLVLMGKCLHILLSTPLSIYLIEIWASGHYRRTDTDRRVFMKVVLAELSSAVWRSLGWAVVNHLLQLQSDKGASRQCRGLTTPAICRDSVDIIYMLYLPSHNQWSPHPGGVATVSQQPLRTGRSTVIDPATAPPTLTTLPQLGQHLPSTGGGAGGEAVPCTLAPGDQECGEGGREW